MFQFESEGRKTGVQVKQSGRKISLLHSGVSAFSVLFRHSTDMLDIFLHLNLFYFWGRIVYIYIFLIT